MGAFKFLITSRYVGVFLSLLLCLVNSDELMPLMERFKKKYPNFEPNAIVDIGANIGEWTTAMQELYPNAKFLMIEATPRHEETLNGVKKTIQQKSSSRYKVIDYTIAVLSNQDNQMVSFYQSGDTGNSMFKEQTHHYKDATPVTRIAQTLDTVIKNSFLKDERIDIIKCDVQGAEFVVFQGGPKAIQQASLIQFEASVVQYNAGGSCLFNTDEYLRSFGMYLYDLGNIMYNPSFKSHGAGQYDVLYMRPESNALPPEIQGMGIRLCGQDQQQQILSEHSNHLVSNSYDRVTMFLSGFAAGLIAFWVMLSKIKFPRAGNRKQLI